MRKLKLVEIPSDAVETPLSEQAYRLLRAKILNAEIEPGAKLKTDELQRQYGFSNSPVREALNRLAAEGLVLADERRGFRAGPISLADFEDLTAYRLVIERAALVEAMTSATDQWEASILAAFHLLDAAEAPDRPRSPTDAVWSGRHKAFHMALLAGRGDSRLIAQCSEMFDQAERYRRLSAGNRAKEPRAGRIEHQRIMEAALTRDIEATASLLCQHVEKTAQNVAKLLKLASAT